MMVLIEETEIGLETGNWDTESDDYMKKNTSPVHEIWRMIS